MGGRVNPRLYYFPFHHNSVGIMQVIPGADVAFCAILHTEVATHFPPYGGLHDLLRGAHTI